MKVVPYVTVVAATPLHDGTNSANIPLYLSSFLIQNNSGEDLFIGEQDVTGDTNGVTIGPGCTLKAVGPNSRGETSQYDMRQVYYIGGAFKLIYDKGD